MCSSDLDDALLLSRAGYLYIHGFYEAILQDYRTDIIGVDREYTVTKKTFLPESHIGNVYSSQFEGVQKYASFLL